MHMIPIAPGVTQIALAPRRAINAYLIGSVLVDAGIRASARGRLTALAGQPLTAHVLTHAHPDHQGASAAICAARGQRSQGNEPLQYTRSTHCSENSRRLSTNCSPARPGSPRVSAISPTSPRRWPAAT